MRLVVLLGIVDSLDRDLCEVISARALQEHLHLVFEALALAVDEFCHELEGDAAEAGLGVAYPHACNI